MPGIFQGGILLRSEFIFRRIKQGVGGYRLKNKNKKQDLLLFQAVGPAI